MSRIDKITSKILLEAEYLQPLMLVFTSEAKRYAMQVGVGMSDLDEEEKSLFSHYATTMSGEISRIQSEYKGDFKMQLEALYVTGMLVDFMEKSLHQGVELASEEIHQYLGSRKLIVERELGDLLGGLDKK